jgi:hypothetical protein
MTGTAAADTVVRLQQLEHAGHQAADVGSTARALELYERAVAAAEASLPSDSLIIAALLHNAVSSRSVMSADVAAARRTPHLDEAVLRGLWRSDERLLTASRKILMLCYARWRAGTLFMPTPEERAFCAGKPISAQVLVMPLYFVQAKEALQFWPTSRTDAEEEERLRAVHGALCAALEMNARGYFVRRPDTGRPWADTTSGSQVAATLRVSLLKLTSTVLDDTAWHQMRSVCGMSDADDEALAQMVQRLAGRDEAPFAGDARVLLKSFQQKQAATQERAAADVARHGLRACALPGCGATEPQPKTFKLCGRCRGVVYCSAAHQAEDWRRHKRADGCKTPP